MKKVTFVLGLFISSILFISLSGCYYDNEQELYQYVSSQQCDTTNVTFSGTILPIFNSYCNNCHSTSMHNGEIILDTYNGANVVASNGRLIGSINWSSGFSSMPQSGAKLSDCDIKKIQAWINAGHLNN